MPSKVNERCQNCSCELSEFSVGALDCGEFVNGLLRHQRRRCFGSDDLHIPIGEELVAEVVVTLEDVETTTIVDAVLNGVARPV